ncbi:host cell division inhibitor Icd-like protein [Pasteurellaceae bacterium HPA106]|uniref:host cell division inhibitor Icd-like protein n=1 Tax=Spirabiliibacterium pneumoniae TaxID=221400 RepID=UPI001AAC4DCE|nr:host cell division inhibitor Icd-like protein [Spirabiliibacterium pneumoniae]MBE2895700.1 host cell division inhibitor Icd-like protein [Spirabiliibacterium pneumoniae]
MFTYIFAGIIRTDTLNHIYKIRITAPTESQARAMLSPEMRFLFVGQIAPRKKVSMTL